MSRTILTLAAIAAIGITATNAARSERSFSFDLVDNLANSPGYGMENPIPTLDFEPVSEDAMKSSYGPGESVIVSYDLSGAGWMRFGPRDMTEGTKPSEAYRLTVDGRIEPMVDMGTSIEPEELERVAMLGTGRKFEYQ